MKNVRGLYLIAASILLATGCTSTSQPPAPAPAQMSIPIPPAQVAQRAARQLTIDGFTVSVSDAAAGIVTATLERRGKGDWGPLVNCKFGPDAIGRDGATMTLTARVAASSQQSGPTLVVIAAEAVSRYEAGGLRSQLHQPLSSMTDCVSSGEVEKRIAAALAAP